MDKRVSAATITTTTNNRNNNRGRHRFPNSPNPSNITATVLVSTIAVSAVAWIIAFAGSIAYSQSKGTIFPKFTWWSLVFQLLVVIILPLLYFFDSIHYYHQLCLIILSISFIYTSNSTNNLVYFTDSASAAAAAGFILLSMTNAIWLYILGTSPNAPYLPGINTYTSQHQQQQNLPLISQQKYQSSINIPSNYIDNNYSTNLDEGHELEGFENPVTSTSPSTSLSHRIIDPEGTNFTGISDVSQYLEAYPIVVRALYDYQASPDDVNELSFSKGEILRVKNTNDNWWQAKNKRGEIGMCPSNYLEIVSS